MRLIRRARCSPSLLVCRIGPRPRRSTNAASRPRPARRGPPSRLSACASVSPTVSRGRQPSSAIRQNDLAAVFRFLARWPSRRGSNLSLVGHFLIIAKVEEHDIRVSILGMGREVAILRHIPVLVIATTDLHDLQRTVLLEPLFDLINGLREPADKGRGGHWGCPYLATKGPTLQLLSVSQTAAGG